MTRRLEVSEKTLELNLAAEILRRLRASPRLSRAYLIGMTQAQERLSGVDASLASDLVVVGAIQFKAPHAPTKRPEYRFTLPGRQLGCLQRLAPRLRGRVVYALPCVSRWDELRVTSPDVLSATIRLRVSGLSPGTHRVVVSSSTVTITSDPVVVPRVALVHEIDEWATEFESQPVRARPWSMCWVGSANSRTWIESSPSSAGAVNLHSAKPSAASRSWPWHGRCHSTQLTWPASDGMARCLLPGGRPVRACE
jgi:hypothetical protein